MFRPPSRTVAAGVFSPLLTGLAVAEQTAAAVEAVQIHRTNRHLSAPSQRRAVASDSQRREHHPLNTSLVIRTPGSQVGEEGQPRKEEKQ